MLVKIKSDSTKEVIRYKTKRCLRQELRTLRAIGVKILNFKYYDETQSWGGCEKLIIIAK